MNNLYKTGIIVGIILVLVTTALGLSGAFNKYGIMAGFFAKPIPTAETLNETNTTTPIAKIPIAIGPTKVGSATVNAGGITAIGSLNK